MKYLSVALMSIVAALMYVNGHQDVACYLGLGAFFVALIGDDKK